MFDESNEDIFRVWNSSSLPDIRANLTSANFCRRNVVKNVLTSLEGSIIPVSKPVVYDLFKRNILKDNVGFFNRIDEIADNLSTWIELEQLEDILQRSYTNMNQELDKLMQAYTCRYRIISTDLEFSLQKLKIWPHLHRLGVKYEDLVGRFRTIHDETILKLKQDLVNSISLYESIYEEEKCELLKRIHALKHKSEFMAMLTYEKEFFDRIYGKPDPVC